jgi:undecaprenyl-diphosphatase
MPIIVLLILALAAGTLLAYVGSRYPTPVVGQDPADAAAGKIQTQMEQHPWLLRLVYERLDPATATGLALTLALGLAIAGGMLISVLAYLVRSSQTLVDVDVFVGQWGVDNRTSWSTDALRLITQLGSTYFIVIALIVVAVLEYVRIPNRWVPVFLVTVMVGDVVVVNTIKGILNRVRPTFDPIAERLGPSFPSGHSAAAAAFYAAAALVLARRRSPRTRALLAGAAVAIAVAVACSRVLLGVHWMSDVIAGLAFGWAWFGICAIAFGGRFLVLGAPVEQAADSAVEQVRPHERPARTPARQAS